MAETLKYPRKCTCPHERRPLGRHDGIDMGMGVLRMSTTPGCPEHDSCHGYTRVVRERRGTIGHQLYCPIHRTKACPDA